MKKSVLHYLHKLNSAIYSESASSKPTTSLKTTKRSETPFPRIKFLNIYTIIIIERIATV